MNTLFILLLFSQSPSLSIDVLEQLKIEQKRLKEESKPFLKMERQKRAKEESIARKNYVKSSQRYLQSNYVVPPSLYYSNQSHNLFLDQYNKAMRTNIWICQGARCWPNRQ